MTVAPEVEDFEQRFSDNLGKVHPILSPAAIMLQCECAVILVDAEYANQYSDQGAKFAPCSDDVQSGSASPHQCANELNLAYSLMGEDRMVMGILAVDENPLWEGQFLEQLRYMYGQTVGHCKLRGERMEGLHQLGNRVRNKSAARDIKSRAARGVILCYEEMADGEINAGLGQQVSHNPAPFMDGLNSLCSEIDIFSTDMTDFCFPYIKMRHTDMPTLLQVLVPRFTLQLHHEGSSLPPGCIESISRALPSTTTTWNGRKLPGQLQLESHSEPAPANSTVTELVFSFKTKNFSSEDLGANKQALQRIVENQALDSVQTVMGNDCAWSARAGNIELSAGRGVADC